MGFTPVSFSILLLRSAGCENYPLQPAALVSLRSFSRIPHPERRAFTVHLAPLTLYLSFTYLLSDDLDQDPLFSTAVKLTVKDLLPGPKIQLTICHRNNHFSTHDLPFHMGVRIILTYIMLVL